jgi:ionotropic glutamate receptor NMDA 1
MEDLDNGWILLNNAIKCKNKDDNSPATLGLNNMRGVFILVGGGIIGGLGLIVIEIVYKKHQMKKQKRMLVARMALSKWRGAIEVSCYPLQKANIQGKLREEGKPNGLP